MQLQEISISSILSLKCFLNIFLFSLQNETFQKSVATLYNFPRVQSSLILKLSRNICYSTSGKFNKTGLKLAVCVCLCVCIKKKKFHLEEMGFHGGSVIKNLLTMQETQVRSLSRKDPLEKEMATHSSIFAWEIPWIQEPGGLQSMGS